MYRESESIELKRELTKDLKKEIVAFANTKGGTIYIGVEDDGNVVGVENPNKIIESISCMIHEGISNDLTPYSSIEIINENNKDIIAIHIMSGPNKPYYITDKGLKSSGVYLRLGTSSIGATDEIIRKMIMESNSITFENEICSNQNLTFNYAQEFFKSLNILFENNKFRVLKMISKEKFNNLALLVSDQNPYTIKCAIFEGKTKIIFKDRKEFTGSCFKQINDAFEYLNLVNRISSTFKGLIRVDKKDYPDFSLREALLNSIIHRNYNFSGSILLSIFDDRIEINSIGGLLSTLTLNDIYNGVSETRNPNFAELFHRLNYVENYGTGIGRIMREYDDEKNKPLIEISENVFKITLPNRNYIEIKNTTNISHEDCIIDYLKINKSIKREDVENILNLSKSGARKVINKMINDNIIEQNGKGKNVYYILK